jgi:hypothetical protein
MSSRLISILVLFSFSIYSHAQNNDECTDAFAITVNGPSISSLIPSADYSTSSGDPSCEYYGWSSQVDSWYSFEAPSSGMAQIILADNLSGSGDAVHYEFELYSGICGALSSIACSNGNDLNGYIFSGLTGGDTYTLRIWHRWGASSGTYDISVLNPIGQINVGNQVCADLTIASNLADDVCSFAYPIYDDDVESIYTFIPSVTSAYNFEVTGITDNDVGIMITDGLTTSNNCLGSDFDASTIRDLYVDGLILTSGTTYYVIIIGDGTSIGDLSGQACITISAQCGSSYNTSVPSSDCGSSNYTARINFTSLGAIGVTYDLVDDQSVTINNIIVSTDYDFSYSDLTPHTVTLYGYDAVGNIVCEEDIMVMSDCNGAETCVNAPDIISSCFPGDLSIASDETNTVDGSSLGISLGSGNSIYTCGGGTYYSSYRYTDETDIWYSINIPDGSNEFTLDFTGLTDRIMVIPYTGSCGSLTPFPLTNGGLVAVSSSGGATSESFAVPDGAGNASITYGENGGTFIQDNSTAPIYIRILATTTNPSPGNSDCSNIVYPSFASICGSAPQPNDIACDAVNITVNNLVDTGTPSTGNYASAADEGNSIDCTGSAVSDSDLWYEIIYPDVPSVIQSFNTEITLSGTAGQTVRVLVYDVTTSCGGIGAIADVDHCEEVTLTGGNDILDLNGLTTTDNFSRYMQIIPVGTVDNVTASATVVYENNNCSHFQNVLPGYDITSGTSVNFNYSSNSGSAPINSGNDLWFQFSPNSGNDGYSITNSTSADVTVSGLNTSNGEEITLIVYEGNGLSANNCVDLSNDYISTITLSSNSTFNEAISCLDENHGSTDGGYLVRIVQTAGSSTSNPSVSITPSAPGPSNNSCSNIFNGSPAIGPSGNPNSDAAHNWNQFWIQNGETVIGDFTGANDCIGYSGVCSGIDYEAISESNDRDLWYIFEVPDNQCSSLGLTQSTVIESMSITYDAGNSFHDAVAYVYSACDPNTLLTCSGSLDGAGTTWEATGLIQGEYYLLRIKPWDISSNPTDWTFNLSVNDGPVRPCNDLESNAYTLGVDDCSNYASLDTYSARGANDETLFGQNDVWFEFTAPSPANGNSVYFNVDKSWVTVFLEAQSNHIITMELYELGVPVATADAFSVNGTGDRVFAEFGHLTPGWTYQIRLRHNQTVSTDVEYKIEVVAEGEVSPMSCGEQINNTAARLCGSCGGTDQDNTGSLCETWYKIDLPVGTPGNEYWVIEVRGYDQVLDFELRSQYLTESSANEGGIDDYDHPCSSRPLEPSASLISSTPVGYEVTAGNNYNFVGGGIGTSSCQNSTIDPPYGGGFKKVYQSLNGPASGQKDFYYLRVFMDPDDVNADACGLDGAVTIDPCEVIFKGPFSTQTLAQIGGTPDVACAISVLGVEMASLEGNSESDYNLLRWETNSEYQNDRFIVRSSIDGNEFRTIGEVEGNGTTDQQSFYSFEDFNRFPDITYYELIQVDQDGTQTTYYISVKSDSKLILYPNPVRSGQKLQIASSQTIYQVIIKDQTGRPVLIEDTLGQNTELNTEQLESGNYHVEIHYEHAVEIEHLIIVH